MTTIYRKPALNQSSGTRQQELLAAWTRLDDCFDMRVADTPELLDQVHRLRFQVYCREKAFEAPMDSADGYERDIWDPQSTHLLIRRRADGIALATTRLVLMPAAGPQPLFPVERHVGLDPAAMSTGPWFLPRASLAEVSRFAISRQVRRTLHASGKIPAGVGDSVLGAWVTLRLVKGLVDLSRYHAVDHWYSFMERGFFRLLQRLGLHFQPTGEAFEFHGRRYLSLDGIERLMRGMRDSQPALFAAMGFADGVSQDPGPFMMSAREHARVC